MEKNKDIEINVEKSNEPSNDIVEEPVDDTHTIIEEPSEDVEDIKEEINYTNDDIYDPETGEIKKTKFDVFGWIGFISGLAVLLISFFGFGFFVFWIGIVFSCIGKKSLKNKKLADYGLLFSIFAFVVAIALFIFVN